MAENLEENLIEVKINLYNGEAAVYFSGNFLRLDPLLKADILQDISVDIEDQYIVSRVHMREKEYNKIKSNFIEKE